MPPSGAFSAAAAVGSATAGVAAAMVVLAPSSGASSATGTLAILKHARIMRELDNGRIELADVLHDALRASFVAVCSVELAHELDQSVNLRNVNQSLRHCVTLSERAGGVIAPGIVCL